MNEQQRLYYHQKFSAPYMEELGIWLSEQRKEVEENGPLGAAIRYSLDRWTELNEFLHTPGVPLSNAECERTIKLIIMHRKNSLFYKTIKGAHVGDCLLYTSPSPRDPL